MKKQRHVTFSDCETIVTDSHCTPQRSAASPSRLGVPQSCKKHPQVKRVLSMDENRDEEPGVSPKKSKNEPYYKAWKSEDGKDSAVLLSPEVVTRLYNSFTLHRDSFPAFISLYAEHKFSSVFKVAHPYTVPKSFYRLFKSVASVTHELFADAINASGVLPYFCSINKDDLSFGSVGPWESVEKEVDGGAGHPPFADTSLLTIVRTIHEHLLTGRPYCRALILPYQEGTELYDLILDDMLGAEIVAIIKPELQSNWFMHQLNYFRYDHQQYAKEEEFTLPVCVAVWINESYRRKYPPPADVEECFQSWEHNNFGPHAEVVDYNAVDNCFPERTRGGYRESNIFEVCAVCK